MTDIILPVRSASPVSFEAWKGVMRSDRKSTWSQIKIRLLRPIYQWVVQRPIILVLEPPLVETRISVNDDPCVQQRLRDFLSKRFSTSELKRFIADHYPDLYVHLPSSGVLTEVDFFHQVVRVFARRTLICDELAARLRQVRPKSTAEIQAIFDRSG